jgi:dihydroorotase
MITRTSSLVVIEGNFVVDSNDSTPAAVRSEGSAVRSEGSAAAPTVPRRVEIDIKTGLITSVSAPRGTGDIVLDEDFLVFSGLVDQHVHAREDPSGKDTYKESFQTAADAALHGGIVAYVEMPNNPQPPVDDASYIAKRELTSGSFVDVLLYAGVGPQTSPLSFPAPYKTYMGPSIGDLFFEDEAQLRDALSRYRGQFIAFHAEDPVLLERHRGAPTHAESRPREAEIEAIDLILRIAENYGFRPHICHLTTAEGLELIRAARKRGVRVTTEVTPHHLYYDQDNAAAFAHTDFLQCNPPIRTRLDRIALLEGLRCGDIECLASDHAPHTVDEKERGMSGVTHLDTFGPFLFWLMSEGFDLATLQRVASENPGRMISRYLPHRYGKVEPGFVGSLTILKKEEIMIRRGDLKTRAGWSPFEGVTFGGRVSHSIVRGRIFPQNF